MEPLILASGSPRRAQLLKFYGVPFEVIPSEADEAGVIGSGRERVLELALRKGREVARRYPGRYVLAADTLVCLDSEIMGKPRDKADAARMLRSLSDREHEVCTGVCLILPDGREIADVDATRVRFLHWSDEDIQRYIATGEPMDKAGAYGMQGLAGIMVSGIQGSPTGVIGLPLGLVTELFRKGGIEFWPESIGG